MTTAALTSLAILKGNWDESHSDFVDILIPFVAEAIRRLDAPAVSSSDVRGKLEQDFGLRIPISCIGTVLGRAAKRGYVRRDQGVYLPNFEALSRSNFAQVQANGVEVHTKLVDKLVAFVAERFGDSISSDSAEQLLLGYLKEFDIDILSAAIGGTPIPDVAAVTTREVYVVGAFAKHLADTDGQTFAWLETVVKGHMLANVVFFPDVANVARRITNTVVFLDTPFLMNALGYNGRAFADPCRETLDLLYELGGEAACFEHTLTEIEGILVSCAELMEQGSLRDVYGPRRRTLDHFLRSGLTASDIRLAVVRLEKDLEAKRVKVKSKPPYTPRYVVDEKELGGTLENRVTYHRNGQALERDVDSLSAVHRLRKDRHPIHLENCGALFVSPNIDLVLASNEFFGRFSPASTVPVAVTNVILTNLLWLKRPLRAPDLPRKLVIASAFAATQPSDALWQRYLSEIQKLRASGRVTPDEYILLRESLYAKDLLMDATKGKDTAFTEGTVTEVLERAKENLAAQIRAEYQAREQAMQESQAKVGSELADLRTQLATRQARDELRENNLRQLSERLAQVFVRAVRWVVYVGVLMISGLVGLWGLSPFSSGWVRYLAGGIFILAMAISMFWLVKEGWVTALARRVEVSLGKWLFRRLMKMIG